MVFSAADRDSKYPSSSKYLKQACFLLPVVKKKELKQLSANANSYLPHVFIGSLLPIPESQQISRVMIVKNTHDLHVALKNLFFFKKTQIYLSMFIGLTGHQASC